MPADEPQFISAETCGTCRYSDPRIGDDGDPYLRCRRYPPVVTMLDATEPLSVFSQTDAAEWCGEWKAADG
jgi:hypothetical protein